MLYTFGHLLFHGTVQMCNNVALALYECTDVQYVQSIELPELERAAVMAEMCQ